MISSEVSPEEEQATEEDASQSFLEQDPGKGTGTGNPLTSTVDKKQTTGRTPSLLRHLRRNRGVPREKLNL